ncbi:MAG: type II toxin-antitoxin system RelE family toxin [Eubacteriaceae bacterium]
MAHYKIYWKKSAEKDLLNLDKKLIPKIVSMIESLSTNPFPKNIRKLHGTDKIFRIRVGNHRIIYLIDEQQSIIVIYYIRHRKEVYRRI